MGDPILLHADLETLRPLATSNLVALFGAMSGLEGGVLERGAEIGRHLSFPTNPMFKGAWLTRTSGDPEALIDDTINWFRARGAPFFFWWTDDDTLPTDLGHRLEARGFLSMEAAQTSFASGIVQTAAGAPVMGMDLADADETMLARVPAGCAIREVSDTGALADFKQVFVETYGIPEWAGQAWVDATMAFGIGRSPWRIFVGYLDDRPVATNMLFCCAGVASVYAVATVPQAQHKGIGTAITLHPLLEARRAGYRYAVLFATEEGFPVYKRMGFADTGGRINRYMWRAS